MNSSDQLIIKPLGAGQEVGRSCIFLEFKGKRILLDCGIHPGLKGYESLPRFDLIDISSVHLVLITHFHLDHIAALPYLTEKTPFSGAIYMTKATKNVMKMLLKDFIRVSISDDTTLYNADDIVHCYNKIQSVDFKQEKEILIDTEGIKFTAYPAGHVLGASMFLIEIDNVKILYTGDYSTQSDHHLSGAVIPSKRIDIVIVESTFGTQEHPSPEEREREFTQIVSDVVLRGGHCLIPTFALGRAQELLLILDDFWANNPNHQSIPIYYASQIVNQSLATYRSSINMMNESIKQKSLVRNPFQFRYISTLNNNDFECIGPCVVLASPAMLESGLSRELFEKWCSDSRNAVVMTGYSVKGTFGKELRTEPTFVRALNGGTLERKCSIFEISFSAHSDFPGTKQFIQTIDPYHVVLVHGERKQVANLFGGLKTNFANRINNNRLTIHTPIIGEDVQLKFSSKKIIKIVGKLSNEISKNPNDNIEGILVYKNYSHLLLHQDDLCQYTKVLTTEMYNKQYLPFHHDLSLLYIFLKDVFSDIEYRENTSIVIQKHILITLEKTLNKLTIQWKSNPKIDLIADTAISVILHTENSPSTIKITSGDCTSFNPKTNLIQSIVKLLSAQYGHCEYNELEDVYEINNRSYIMDLNKKQIAGDVNTKMYKKLFDSLDRLIMLTEPIPEVI